MDAAMRKIKEQVLKKIKPAKQEFDEVDLAIKKINALLKKHNLQADCVAAGSYAKGTILKDDFDVDLFVRFEYDYKDEDISGLLYRAIFSMKPNRVHGSRDYFQLKRKDIKFEIIPVIKIDDYKKALNVTDMSPLHVFYVKKHYEKNPALRDEVRLAKQFCKATKVYGAESYIRGFSGHVIDLLIIYYESFERLLAQACMWKNRVIIDIENHHDDPMNELNNAKLESPLIMIDPIQPDRNAAAALSEEAFERFKRKARAFLDKPSEEYFQIKSINITEVKKKRGKDILLMVKIIPQTGNEDVAGTKVLKCYDKIIKEFEGNDFNILKSNWEFEPEKSLMYFLIKKEKLSEKIIIRGPPAKARIDSERFRQKHSKVFEKDGRLFAEEKRAYLTPDRLMRDLVSSSYMRERVKKIRLG